MFSCPIFQKVEFIDLLVNAPYYGHLLNVHGVLAFPKINISGAQQNELCRRLGDFVNWVPNSNNPVPLKEPFIESFEPELTSKKKKTPFLTEFSMNVLDRNPSVGSVLNNFGRTERAGSILLADMRKVFNSISTTERKEFISKIVWLEVNTNVVRRMVEYHRNTNQKILLYNSFFKKESETEKYRFFIDGKEINEEQRLLLSEIFQEIDEMLYVCNLYIVEEWKWKDKDLLIIDDSCMMRATKAKRTMRHGDYLSRHQICTATNP